MSEEYDKYKTEKDYEQPKAYSFVARTMCKKMGCAIDALCLFFGASDSVEKSDFDAELKLVLESSKVLPDCVVIIADKKEGSDKFLKYWDLPSSSLEVFRRDRGVRNGKLFLKSYYFVALEKKRGLSAKPRLMENGIDFEIDVDDIIEKGLNNLVSKNEVINIAPAGHVFGHASKATSKIFIRAGDLAMSEVEIAFVGWCLSHKLRPLLKDDATAKVYIDAMAIYPVVRQALNFLASNARIHTYHSYKNFSEFSPPSPEPYAVVISASTSGTMAKRLHEEKDFKNENIITLVGLREEDSVGSVMIDINDDESLYKKILKDGGEMQGETRIELFGEHFSLKLKPPRAVVLAGAHAPRKLYVFLREFGLKGVRDFNEKVSNKRQDRHDRMIRFNSCLVGENKCLEDWLDKEVSWCVASSIDHVLYANDAESAESERSVGSKKLGEKLAEIIARAKGCEGGVKIISHDDLFSNKDILKNARGVLVVQAVAGDGGMLREISRDLREFLDHTVPRHFLVGVGLPQDQRRWDLLRKFLVKNAGEREYGFSVWLKVLVGTDDVGHTWEEVKSRLKEDEMPQENQKAGRQRDDKINRLLDESKQLSRKVIENSSNGFVSNNKKSKLKLSEGFTFFADAFKGEGWKKVSDSTIYATIAAVLQSARDSDNLGNKLRSTGYESVVLDPENFLRFNDAILQVCILRAARRSELDYSSSPDFSRHMKEILIKVFERHKYPYGRAAMEFAAALICRKMKLIESDLEEVKEKAIELLSKSNRPSALLGLIAMI